MFNSLNYTHHCNTVSGFIVSDHLLDIGTNSGKKRTGWSYNTHTALLISAEETNFPDWGNNKKTAFIFSPGRHVVAGVTGWFVDVDIMQLRLCQQSLKTHNPFKKDCIII